tara:strand:+ start:495 stop:692 length:198 start_codon:yes stop_codon:yes gene_type:complete
MAYKEFQIIIGSIILGLCIVLGSYIYSQNSGYNACLKQALASNDQYDKSGRMADYREIRMCNHIR